MILSLRIFPVSGSGTWGRNPDSLYFFDINEAGRYQAMQKKIFPI